MINKMNIEELENKLKISKDTCIHCPTLELAKQVLNIFHKLGLEWCDHSDYKENHNWDSFKENSVYSPFDGQVSPLAFADFTGCKIISAEEFIALHIEDEEFDLENYTPKGDLKDFPKEHWPPVAVTHFAFQIMIFFGTVMMGISVLYLFALFFKKNWLEKHWLLKLFIIATPFGYIALEAGWTVTEVGRQPWIIYGIMKTAEAVTPMPGIQYSFYLFTLIFISLSLIIIFLLRRQIKMVPYLYDSTDPLFHTKK